MVSPSAPEVSLALSATESADPVLRLLERERSIDLDQSAIAALQSSIDSLHSQIKLLKADAIYGQLHPYPHRGLICYNFYPYPGQESLKKNKGNSREKRSYVRQGDVEMYRLKIVKGARAAILSEIVADLEASALKLSVSLEEMFQQEEEMAQQQEKMLQHQEE